MRIHVHFTARNMCGSDGRLTAYVYHQSGGALNDTNGRYATTGGSVAVGRDLTPRYARTVFNNFELFMPYAELHMACGEHKLKFREIGYHNVRRRAYGIRAVRRCPIPLRYSTALGLRARTHDQSINC